jgi:hypothetical protein
MGQWGAQKYVQGHRFIPHVETQAWDQASPENMIDDIFCMNALNFRDAEEITERLKAEYVGQPYRMWLDLIDDRVSKRGT